MTVISEILLVNCLCPLIFVVAFLEQPSNVKLNLTSAHLNRTYVAVNANRDDQSEHQPAPHVSLPESGFRQQNQSSVFINGSTTAFQSRRNLTAVGVHSSRNQSASGTLDFGSTTKPRQYGNQYLIHTNSFIHVTAPYLRTNPTVASIHRPGNQSTSTTMLPYGSTQRQHGNQHALSVLLSHGSHSGGGFQSNAAQDGNGVNALCQKVCRGNSPCPPECSNLQPWSIVKRSNTRKRRRKQQTNIET